MYMRSAVLFDFIPIALRTQEKTKDMELLMWKHHAIMDRIRHVHVGAHVHQRRAWVAFMHIPHIYEPLSFVMSRNGMARRVVIR